MTINKPLNEVSKNDLPVKLPNGKLHVGWPSRMDTPQEMIRDFKEGRLHPIISGGRSKVTKEPSSISIEEQLSI
jgi:hypothetical protein